MRKLLFLLLILPFIAVAQVVPPDATPLENIQVTNNIQSTTASRASVQENNGVLNYIPINSLPITLTPVNYAIPNNQLVSHLSGIDTRLGQIGNTTAGITNRIYFTGDNTTVTAGTFFTSSATGKGSVTAASPTPLVNADNQKQYFNKDIISVAQPSTAIGPPGNYSGQLSVRVSPTPNGTSQRYTIEIYKCNNGGTPIASGITGAPVGSLGVTVVTILDSGLLNLVAGSVTNISLSGNLASTLTLNTGERLRYHVSAAKVNAGGANVTMEVFYGSDYNSYYDITVSQKTSTVLNDSGVSGLTASDALNTLNTLKANDANVIHTTGNETKTGSLTVNNSIIAAQPLGSVSRSISQTMADSDSWLIYGADAGGDKGEMVFQVGDNGVPFNNSPVPGQRFRFHYDATSSGVSKDPFIIDYNEITANANIGIGIAPQAAIHSYSITNTENIIDAPMGSSVFTMTSASLGASFVGFSNKIIFGKVTGFGTAGFSEFARIETSGNVLIGTSTDDLTNKLQVNGSAKISSLAGTATRTVVADASGNLSATDIAPTSGTYTPTYVAGTNITSLTNITGKYTRVGNLVTVFFRCSAVVSSAASATDFTVSFPASLQKAAGDSPVFSGAWYGVTGPTSGTITSVNANAPEFTVSMRAVSNTNTTLILQGSISYITN